MSSFLNTFLNPRSCNFFKYSPGVYSVLLDTTNSFFPRLFNSRTAATAFGIALPNRHRTPSAVRSKLLSRSIRGYKFTITVHKDVVERIKKDRKFTFITLIKIDHRAKLQFKNKYSLK